MKINISQLEYSWRGALYYAGVTLHTRRFVFYDEGEMAPSDEAVHKTSCAWWVYGEQPVWKSDGKTITCMAQYSENTCPRAVATVMLRLEALIPTVSTYVASPDSMHSSVRTMNSRWN